MKLKYLEDINDNSIWDTYKDIIMQKGIESLEELNKLSDENYKSY